MQSDVPKWLLFKDDRPIVVQTCLARDLAVHVPPALTLGHPLAGGKVRNQLRLMEGILIWVMQSESESGAMISGIPTVTLSHIQRGGLPRLCHLPLGKKTLPR